MPGSHLLDTNVIIQLLSGQKEHAVISNLDCVVCISVITEIELLSYPKLTTIETIEIKRVLGLLRIVMIDTAIKDQTIHIRRQYGLKTPDAIIAATAVCVGAIIVTDDKVFTRLQGVSVVSLSRFLQ